MLIGICLMILVVLMVFTIILGESFISISDTIGVDNTSLVNGTLTTYEVPYQEVLFEIDPVIAGIALIVALVAVASVIGIKVLASGLSDESVRVLIHTAVYTGIWSVLSIMSIELIQSIAIFGGIIYVVITLGYAIGVIQKLSGA